MAHTIKVNDVLIHTVSNADINVLNHVTKSASVEQNIIDAIVYIMNKKVDKAFTAIKRDGIPLLETSGATTISLDRDTLVAAIMTDGSYLDKDAVDLLVEL